MVNTLMKCLSILQADGPELATPEEVFNEICFG